MRYQASVTDFFKSPKWGANLLLGAVTVLIPVVGQLVLSGWHVTLFWARGDDEDPVRFPPFDFQYFGKYLERGLWPFLVSLVAGLVMVPVMMAVVIGPIMMSGIAVAGMSGDRLGELPIAILVSMFAFYPVVMAGFQLILIPLMLRATITQDFASAFDFGFVRNFIAIVWKELLVSLIFLFGVGICLMAVTVITCYTGGFLLGPVVIFSWHHLQKQLYQLYLARGGGPVPLNPKLNDLPPVLPGA